MSQFLTDFLADNPEVDEETTKQLRDTAAAILSGMDQIREALGYKMGTVPWKRMGVLADRLALELVDYTPEEGMLVGSWMVASSRAQILGRDEEPTPDAA